MSGPPPPLQQLVMPFSLGCRVSRCMCNTWITAITMLEAQFWCKACLVVYEGSAIWSAHHVVSGPCYLLMADVENL